MLVVFRREPTNEHSSHQNAGVFKNFLGVIPTAGPPQRKGVNPPAPTLGRACGKDPGVGTQTLVHLNFVAVVSRPTSFVCSSLRAEVQTTLNLSAETM